MNPEAAQAVAAAINAGKPIATHAEGWTYASIGIWVFGLIGTPTVIVALFKLIAAMRKLANEREATLDDERRGDMVAMRQRMKELEERVEQTRIQYEAKLEQQRAEFAAELAKMRHKANNATQRLDALLMLLKAAPDKIEEHLATITAMGENQRIAEGAESGHVSAAKIVAAAGNAPPTT